MRADDLSAPSGHERSSSRPSATPWRASSPTSREWEHQTNKFTDADEEVMRVGVDTGNGEVAYVWPRKGSAMARPSATPSREAKLPELVAGQTLKLQYSEDRRHRQAVADEGVQGPPGGRRPARAAVLSHDDALGCSSPRRCAPTTPLRPPVHVVVRGHLGHRRRLRMPLVRRSPRTHARRPEAPPAVAGLGSRSGRALRRVVRRRPGGVGPDTRNLQGRRLRRRLDQTTDGGRRRRHRHPP